MSDIDPVSISIASELDEELAGAAEALLPQLSTTAVFSRELLERLIASDAVTQFVARVDGRIVGMSSLIVYAIPTGLRAHIDDVVVDAQERGHGVARKLLEAMIARAQELGARTIDLTSRPSREAAIHLYKKVGFVERESLLFRHSA